VKILVVIGTRPEAIKMAPLIRRLLQVAYFECRVCNTGQHKDLLDPVLDFFGIKVDYALQVMKPHQSLHQLTAAIITQIQEVYDEYQPEYTAKNLSCEGITGEILITGNTVIDALQDALRLINEQDDTITVLKEKIDFSKKIILFTGHRRENFGQGFEQIFEALSEITSKRNDLLVVYPVHPNPNVKTLAEKYFSDSSSIRLIDPLDYGTFTWLMQQSYLIMTDSGGIQEEAPSLGKPVLVLREVTERPEAVEAGTVLIVGTDKKKIVTQTLRLIDDYNYYQQFATIINPYGDGKASERIVDYFVQQC